MRIARLRHRLPALALLLAMAASPAGAAAACPQAGPPGSAAADADGSSHEHDASWAHGGHHGAPAADEADSRNASGHCPTRAAPADCGMYVPLPVSRASLTVSGDVAPDLLPLTPTSRPSAELPPLFRPPRG